MLKFIRSVILWSAFFTVTFFVYAFSAHAAAIEVVDPEALCERFDLPKDLKSCQAFVKKNAPDTYVASSCQALDDDKIFMNCLGLAATADIDPKALEGCGGDSLTDADRMSCLQKLASNSRDKFQRLPASAPKLPKTKAK